MVFKVGGYMYTAKDHTFVVCAYKENPYLEKTIRSIENQTVKSKIILSTSTPNEYIENICKRHSIEWFVNPNPNLAGDDWNYGYTQADTPLVTLVHQDDLYEVDFLEETLKSINSKKKDDVIIAYTDYYELKLGRKEVSNLLLRIKRIMNFPLSISCFQRMRFVRRRMLSLGCPICCPAVTYVKKNAGEQVFDTVYKNSCDYKTWVDLSMKKGRFVYIRKPLMMHRIYAESATTLNLSENIRKKEDYEIMCELWPKPIARLINSIYAKSEKSNIV